MPTTRRWVRLLICCYLLPYRIVDTVFVHPSIDSCNLLLIARQTNHTYLNNCIVHFNPPSLQRDPVLLAWGLSICDFSGSLQTSTVTRRHTRPHLSLFRGRRLPPPLAAILWLVAAIPRPASSATPLTPPEGFASTQPTIEPDFFLPRTTAPRPMITSVA